MLRPRITAVVATCAVLAASIGLGQPALADAAQDCRSGAPEARVAGCGRLLAEARTPRQRAIALDGRCKANNDRLSYAEAIPDCTSAIRADDDYPYSFFNRGVALAGLNNHPAAIADFTRAHALRPTFAWILTGRARSYASLGNTAAAARDYEEALRLKPDNEEARSGLASLRGGGPADGGAFVSNTLCGPPGCN